MGRNNHLPIRPRVEERHKYLFVGSPTAARHKQVFALYEVFYQGQMFAGLLYLQHAVEARIACNRNVAKAYRGKQLAALLGLNEKM